MSRFFMTTFLTIWLGCAVCAHAQTQSPMPLQSPTVSATHIAFVYADEIWIVDRKGGTAHRLTSQTGLKGFPVFSPDGSQVAFARILDGNIDVYVAALTGGEPRRLTYHPKGDLPVAWTPDG